MLANLLGSNEFKEIGNKWKDQSKLERNYVYYRILSI